MFAVLLTGPPGADLVGSTEGERAEDVAERIRVAFGPLAPAAD